MELQILDKFLLYLRDTKFSDFNKIHHDVKENTAPPLSNLEYSTLYSAIQKLVKDGYVIVEGEKDVMYSDTVYYKYILSFEGRIFISLGGYTSEVERNEKLQRAVNALESRQDFQAKAILFLTLIIALGTAIAALYYFLEICKDLKTSL